MKIRKSVLKRFAPIYFEATKKHLRNLKNVAIFTGMHAEMRVQIERFMHISGLSAADLLFEYSDEMLDNDEYRMIVLLYTCACFMSNSETLSMEEYRGYMSALNEVMGENFNPHDALRYFSEMFSIQPDLIPQYVKTNMAKDTEERCANDLCDKKLQLINGPDEFFNFDSYHKYVSERAQEIVTSLNGEGYVNTRPVEVLSTIIILKKLNFHMFRMYSIENDIPMPKEVMDALAKKIFSIYKSGLPGGSGPHIIGLDDDSG